MRFLNQMYNLVSNFFRNLPEYGLKTFGWVYLYLSPLHTNLVTIYLLLICDLITGISKAVKRGEPITAHKLTLTLSKFIFYSIALILAYQVDITLFSTQALILVHLVGYYITLIELKSNLENISVLTNTDIWEALKDKITQLFTPTNNNNP